LYKVFMGVEMFVFLKHSFTKIQNLIKSVDDQPFFKVMTVISGQIPTRPGNA